MAIVSACAPVAARSRRQSCFRHNMRVACGRPYASGRSSRAPERALEDGINRFGRDRRRFSAAGAAGRRLWRLRRRRSPLAGAGPRGDAAARRIALAAPFVAKGFGFATDVAPPPDFVQQSRPPEPKAEIPVFTQPNEPPGKPKSAKEVDAIDSDLESIAKRHDALLATFPPSAKAAAAAAAEKKAKSKRKASPAAAAPPL